MFITNFCFLAIFYKYRQNTHLNLNTNNKINYNFDDINTSTKNSGLDQRYNNSTDFNQTLNYKIKENILKLSLLSKLKDNQTSEIDKIKLIEDSKLFDNNIMVNISSGGLMDDYNFFF